MKYWLMKSEPSDYSINDLERDGSIDWYGIRNYQARNFMRDDMQIGDLAFFYHSNCKEPGIVGIMKVCKLAYPDKLQFIEGHKYHDPKSDPNSPRWVNVDVAFVKKIPLVSLNELRQHQQLETLKILQRGNRLSITPLTEDEWNYINQINTI
jgi:predicted RNA-binding protein with PUA-like domain